MGGRAASVTLGGCRFDTGPSLLLFPDKYKEAFEGLGSRLEEHVEIRRVGPQAYRVWFGDNTHLDLLNDHDAMAAQLEAVEPGAGASAEGRAVGSRWRWERGQRSSDRPFPGKPPNTHRASQPPGKLP